MGRKKSKIAAKLEYALAKGLMRIIQVIPRNAALKLGKGLGAFVHDILKIRVEVVREQLRLAYPDKPESWIKETIRNVYRHFGAVASEMALLPVLVKRPLDEWVVTEGMKEAQAAYAKGRGCLFVSGHLGNWEIGGAAGALSGFDVSYVVAAQANKMIEQFMDELRGSAGIKIIKRADAIRGIATTLKKGHLVAMMIDQDARRAGVFVPFFGRMASTPRGIAVYAVKYKPEIIFMSTHRLEDNRIHVKLSTVPFTTSDNRESDVLKLTTDLTEVLEGEIRKHPDQWLWLHKRWKTAPPEGQ